MNLSKDKHERIIAYNKCLKKYFGHEKLKPQQIEIIDDVVYNKRDLLAILATGFGKSICYELPSLLLNKITVVISPLISLMTDQQSILQKLGISSCCLNSTVVNKAQLIDEIKNSVYSIVYISPEGLENQETLFRELASTNKLCLIGIDEAHASSCYGHDFRPAYKKLGVLKKWCKNVPMLALTATADKHVKNDIIEILKLKNPKIITSNFDRPNLYISVQKQTKLKNDIGKLLERFKQEKTIIYCKSRDDTDRISTEVNKMGYKCSPYHAGLYDAQREHIQKEFTEGKIKCIVATIAFGLGINLDVRLIIHYGCPQTMAGYWQECGRAGRTGLPSECHMFYQHKDKMINAIMVNDIKNKEYRRYQEQAIKEIEAYLYTDECRRKILLKHFQDDNIPDRCNNCDNCKSDRTKTDFTYPSYILLSLIRYFNDGFGMCMYVDILRGAKAKKITQIMKKSKYYGKGRELPAQKWKDLIKLLIVHKYISERQVSRFGGSTLSVTPKTVDWLEIMNEIYDNYLNNPATEINKEDRIEFVYNDGTRKAKDISESDTEIFKTLRISESEDIPHLDFDERIDLPDEESQKSTNNTIQTISNDDMIDDLVETIHKLYKKGNSVRKICKDLNITPDIVQDVLMCKATSLFNTVRRLIMKSDNTKLKDRFMSYEKIIEFLGDHTKENIDINKPKQKEGIIKKKEKKKT